MSTAARTTIGLVIVLVAAAAACESRAPDGASRPSSASSTDTRAGPSEPSDRDSTTEPERSMSTERLRKAFDREGTLENGVFKVKWPRRDLEVTLDDYRIIPRMGLTAWAAFAPTADGVVVTGDVPVLRDELPSLHETVQKTPLEVTAAHNHFFGEQPEVIFVHIGGTGPEPDLARAVRSLVDNVGVAPDRSKQKVRSELEPAKLNEAVGVEGAVERGVYKVGGTRETIDAELRGRPLRHRMGFGWWAAIQGTMDEATIAGDFVVRAKEVRPALDAFARAGVDVVALHNHMVREKPRLFYFHYSDTGSARELAAAVGRALEAVRE